MTMSPSRYPRVAASFHERRRAMRRASSLLERLVYALGADPVFTDAVLGDLAEERARREERQSAIAARWWYVREAFRSTPHLLWNAARHGGSRGRRRAAMVIALAALAPVRSRASRHLDRRSTG